MSCPYNINCAENTKDYLQNINDKPFSYTSNEYPPSQYFWGKLSSKVLYIGVNPYSTSIGENNFSPLQILRQGPGLNSYFSTIHKWYPYLYESIGKDNGVAFTDLVKCSSSTFPLKGMPTKNFDAIFRNCRSHLQSLILQMSQLNLKTIIVSGVHPCWHILDIYFPLDNNFDKKIDNICKTTEINGNQINFVFFRQFMGRKDVSHSYRNKASELLDNVLNIEYYT